MIFTKIGMCIDIVEIWFGIADGQISSVIDSYLVVTQQWSGIIVSSFYFWDTGVNLLTVLYLKPCYTEPCY